MEQGVSKGMGRLTLALIAVVGLIPCETQAGKLFKGENPVRDRYIVVLKPGTTLPGDKAQVPGRGVRDVLSGLKLLHGGKVERVFEHALQGGLFTMTEAQARALADNPMVAYVEQDRALPLATNQGPPLQWGLDRIDERDRPMNSHFTYTTTGSGVNAYIIDTGISDDLEFGSRKLNSFTAITDGSGQPQHGDCNGHGTKVAKTLGGATSGVAKSVNLQAVRVATICNCGSGQGNGGMDPPLASTGTCAGILLSDAIAGINWVAANRVKPAVANMSFGGGASQALDDAVQGMINAGVVAVIAAGNNGVSACGVSPARVAAALTVGASDRNDARSVWNATQSSNFGSCVDLFAPGTDLELWNTTTFSGTSAASPLVAGAVARYLQSTPLATPSQAHSYIVSNTTAGRLTNIGAGSPNLLLFTPPGGSETDNPPVANYTSSCTGTNCNFNSTSTDDFGILVCTWDFGHPNDFQNRLGCSLSHLFPGAGSYNVILYVQDDTGHQSQITKIVTVH
jgi:hypothetical protein